MVSFCKLIFEVRQLNLKSVCFNTNNLVFSYEGGAFERLISCYSGAFEDTFCTGGGEFDQSNFKKFKFPESVRGGHVEVSN